MQQFKYAPENNVTAFGCIMKFVSGSFVVAVVDEFACVVIDAVRPIAVFARGEENDETLVLSSAGKAKSSHVATARKQVRNRFAPQLTVTPALVNCVYDKIG